MVVGAIHVALYPKNCSLHVLARYFAPRLNQISGIEVGGLVLRLIADTGLNMGG